MANVKTSFTSDDKDIIATLKRLQAEQIKLREENARLGNQSKRSGMESERSLSGQIAGVAKLAFGYMGLRKVIGAIAAENQKLADSVSATSATLSRAETKFRLQTGLGPADLQRVSPKMEAALKRTPSTTVEGAVEINRALASAGYSKEDVESGKALDSVLQIQAATGSFGEGPQAGVVQAEAIAAFLSAQGKKLTSENTLTAAKQFTALFKSKKIQLGELPDLAKHSATLTAAGMSQEQQLASFAVMRDAMGGAEAGTGLRMVTQRLQGAGEKKSILKQLGITPEEIDLVGESFPDALRRLKEGLDSVDEATRNRLTLKLFGEQGASAANFLMSNADQIDQLAEMAATDETFDQNVADFRLSPEAWRMRMAAAKTFNEQDLIRKGGGFTFEDVDLVLDQALAERHANAKTAMERADLSAQAAAARKVFEGHKAAGAIPIQAVEFEAEKGVMKESALVDDVWEEFRAQRSVRARQMTIDADVVDQEGNVVDARSIHTEGQRMADLREESKRQTELTKEMLNEQRRANKLLEEANGQRGANRRAASADASLNRHTE